ncbi:MAG: hypothetical protein HRT88_22085, partial [Lentisphaeraceae bacterium]|nr:hypothetical protein [Lentisphaeraceae bacterium]
VNEHYSASLEKGYEPVTNMIYLARSGRLIGAAPFPQGFVTEKKNQVVDAN